MFLSISNITKLLLVGPDSYREKCYSSLEMDRTNDEKSSDHNLLAKDFPLIKNVRTSKYFIEGYTIYTLNIHSGWYQWPYDTFEKHLVIAMSNQDMIIPISAGARRSDKEKTWKRNNS